MVEKLETGPIRKYLTKQVFEEARSKGHYGTVTADAQKIIDAAKPMDLLELKTEFGSALRVLEAKRVDEISFCKMLRT